MTTTRTTSQRIARARERRKLKPAELAAKCGVSRSTVHAWEHGGPGPKLKHLRKIAEALEVPVAELVGE